MKGHYKIYYVLGVLGLISAGNYIVFFDTTTLKDELALAVSLALILITYFAILRRIQNPLQKIASLSSRVQKTAPFLKEEKADKMREDELVEAYIEHLVSDIESATQFVTDVKDGKLTSKLTDNANYSEGSLLMRSLTDLRQKLVDLDEEDRERKWVADGMTMFVEILRQNTTTADEFYDNIIKGIVKYLNANQGSLFLYSDEEGKRVLKQVACYAYNRKKFHEKEMEIGQGLVGQVYLEKETVFLTDIPAGYVSITSGLGEAPPRNLLIVPFKLNENVECIVELASFNEFKGYQIEFLEKVGESIASTISSYKINESTRRLLKESQSQAEIMQAQEEELRQNMEELEATQENLQRESEEKAKIQTEIIKARDFIQKVINAIPDPVFVKDRQHKITLTNDAFCIVNKMKKENLIGKDEYDLYSKDEADVYYQKDEELFVEKRESSEEEKVTIGNKDFFRVAKKRIIEDEDGNSFLVAIHHDITPIKEIEKELAKEKYLMDALMKYATDYIYFKDKESRFIRMSDHMLKLFSATTQSDIVGRNDFDFFTEEHARPAFEAEQEIIRTGEPILNLIEKETWDDGRVSWVSTSKMPLQDMTGEVIGTFGISRDVTQSKKKELEVEYREKLLTALISSTGENIMFINAEQQYQFISAAAAERFSLNVEEVIGKNIVEFVHSEDQEKLLSQLKGLKVGEEEPISFRHIGPNGKYEKVQATVSNWLNDANLNGIIVRLK